jgi:hypothetical protein
MFPQTGSLGEFFVMGVVILRRIYKHTKAKMILRICCHEAERSSLYIDIFV